MKAPTKNLKADLFCRVVDNLGDIGVMWRLARQLVHEHDWQVRLWVDDLNSFRQLQHEVDPAQAHQNVLGVEIRRWPDRWTSVKAHPISVAGFSCELPASHLQHLATLPEHVWIQLEYLSAEAWVDSFHGLSSKRGDGLSPVFFFPGFTETSGGLLREADLLGRRDRWFKDKQNQKCWLSSLGVQASHSARLISVFTYPHAPLHRLIEQLQKTGQQFHLLVPSSKVTTSTSTTNGNVVCQSVPFLDQRQYDQLLWSCDLNLVRGEDSFVRAIWAGKPLLWHIYPQKDGVHHDKLAAWLKRSELGTPLATAMHEWSDGKLEVDISEQLTGQGWQQWQVTARAFTEKLAIQTSLADRLIQWLGDESAQSN